jgi:hypothetical protein
MAIDTYPEPDQWRKSHAIQSLQVLTQSYSPTYILVFLVVTFILPFLPVSYVHFLPHSCYMPHSSNLPSLHYNYYTWRRVHVMNLLIMQCSLTSCLSFVQIFSSAPRSETPLVMFLNVGVKISQTYRTRGKILVLCIFSYVLSWIADEKTKKLLIEW